MPDILTKREVEALRCCLRRDVFPRVARTIKAMAALLEAFVLRGPASDHDRRWNEAAHLLHTYHGTEAKEQT